MDEWRNKRGFYKFIIDNNIIGFPEEPIKLSSGRLSPYYINWRGVMNDIGLIKELSNYIMFYVNHLKLLPDCFYGVPEGATKLGVITQYRWAKKMGNHELKGYALPMGRAKPKEHGDSKDKYFIGMPRGKTIVLEDVTTTGDSLMKSIDNLLDSGVEVICAIALTNRNESDIHKRIKNYYAMSDAVYLLEELNPDEEMGKKIENYYKKYGVKK